MTYGLAPTPADQSKIDNGCIFRGHAHISGTDMHFIGRFQLAGVWGDFTGPQTCHVSPLLGTALCKNFQEVSSLG